MDPAMRMLAGADFRGFTTGRVGPKENVLELKRFKIPRTNEGVGPSGLTAADRYDKMSALTFSSSSRAYTFERDFKRIDFGGRFSHFWAEAPKNTKGAPIQLLPYVIGGPSRKGGATKTGMAYIGSEWGLRSSLLSNLQQYAEANRPNKRPNQQSNQTIFRHFFSKKQTNFGNANVIFSKLRAFLVFRPKRNGYCPAFYI